MNSLIRLALLAFWITSARGMLDESFPAGRGPDHFAEQIFPLPDGRILLCGDFHSFNGLPARGLVRLHEDGSVDPTFKRVVNSWVRHLLVQPDGKIVIGGAFSSVEGVPRSLIARLNSDGSLDRTFNPGTGATDKLTPGDPNPPYIFWMALQPDGKILVTGSFAKYNGAAAKGFARLNPDGSLDTTFKIGGGLDSWGRFVNVLPNNQIILTGWFTSYNGQPFNRMVKLNSDGTPDTSFRPFFGDKTAIYSAALLPDGKWLVSGHSKNEQGLFKRGLARLFADGREDPAFVGKTNERTESLLVQADGKFWACGWFTSVNNTSRSGIALFTPDGSLDPLPVWSSPFIWSMAFDRRGNLLVAGGFTSIMGVQKYAIARLKTGSTQQSTEPSSPRLSLRTVSAGDIEITCPSESHCAYTLQRKTSIDGNWSELANQPGTGSELTFRVPADSPASFYRIFVQQNSP